MASFSTSSRPGAKIIVTEQYVNRVKAALVCQDQVDIGFRSSVLPAFFFRKPSARIVDLMRITAAVAHADRRITRRPSVCWGRDIELDIPVSDPDFWSSDVHLKLIRVLTLLTGDCWLFKFRREKEKPLVPEQSELAFPQRGELVTAYSSGLDSFAVARLIAMGEVQLDGLSGSQRDLVLVTTGQKLNAELKQTITPFGYSVRQVSVPFVVRRFGKDFQLRETSFRSRAFVFQTMAALASVQSEGNTVVISESGQGSLGPWMTVTGDECPDIRTHPFFTSYLSEFLECVLEVKIKFAHPQLWETKGQTLQRLVSSKLEKGWEQTMSCAVQARHQKNRGAKLHCGLCPNCLLRRQSLVAAELHDNEEEYDYSCTPKPRMSHKHYDQLKKRVAQGLLPLIEFAEVHATPIHVKIAERKISSFSQQMGVPVNAIKSNMDKLVDVHRQELGAFILSRPTNSLIRRIGEALS